MDWTEHDDGLRLLEAQVGAARAAFSTRTGGVSRGAFESLNIGILTDDDRDAVLENRRRLVRAAGLDATHVLIGRQVHGAEVHWHDDHQDPGPYAEPQPEVPEVDGHATSTPGLAPFVLVADCLPIALSGPGGVAMVHGGWRGLAGGIVERGAELVGATHAAVGPGIGRCCYEVGEEVLDEFSDLGSDVADGRMLDLTAVARALLGRAGVDDVQTADLCTSCNPELFFSHRRDRGRTGRQAGFAWIEAG